MRISDWSSDVCSSDLSADLTARFGRGFSPDNLENMRRFFAAYPLEAISETLSRKSGDGLPIENSEAVSRKFDLSELAQAFTLPWSAYVRLLSVKDEHARQFYEVERSEEHTSELQSLMRI